MQSTHQDSMSRQKNSNILNFDLLEFVIRAFTMCS